MHQKTYQNYILYDNSALDGSFILLLNFKEEVTSVVLPCKQPSCVTNSNNSAEEDKIQEYLNRSDTAVIYPEPVSDPEAQEPEASVPETEEEEEENQDNGKYSSLIIIYFIWLPYKYFI